MTEILFREYYVNADGSEIPMAGCIDFYTKYFNTQLAEFKKILALPEWNEYGIIHLVEKNILNLKYYRKTNGLNYIDIGSTVEQVILNTMRPYRNYSLLSYDTAPQFKETINLSNANPLYRTRGQAVPNILIVKPYLGTIIRFIPITVDFFDVLVFRDAHSTAPSSQNNIDSKWRDTWLTTDKKIWTYTGAFYNPIHSGNMKVPFAATWAIRKFEGEATIMTKENFKRFFDIPVLDPKKFLQEYLYGIDERLMLNMVKKYNLRGRTYDQDTFFVGVVWLGYLFGSQTMPQQFQTMDTNAPTLTQNISLDVTGKLSVAAPQRRPELYDNLNKLYEPVTRTQIIIQPDSNVLPNYSFYQDIRCVIKYMVIYLAEKFGKPEDQVTFEEFFDYVDEKHRNILSKDKRTLYDNLILMVPSKYHIWDYIFRDVIIDTSPIKQYFLHYNNFSWDNLCDINEKYFVGDAFDFTQYVNRGSPGLPVNITNYPHDHPNNVNNKTSNLLFSVANLASLNFSDPDELVRITQIADGWDQINRGGAGIIYSLPTSDKVLKIFALCAPTKEESRPCIESRNGDQVVLLPPVNNISISIMPEYLSELVISSILSSLKRTKYIDGFVRSYNTYYDKNAGQVYIIQQKLEPLNKPQFFSDYRSICSFLFENYCSLYLAQKSARFTHYDLHVDNIMKKQNETTRNVKINNFYFTGVPSRFEIIDFGGSVCSYTDKKNERIDVLPKIRDDITENPRVFSEYFDLFTLLLNVIANWHTNVKNSDQDAPLDEEQQAQKNATFAGDSLNAFNYLHAKTGFLDRLIQLFFKPGVDARSVFFRGISCWSHGTCHKTAHVQGNANGFAQHIYKPNSRNLLSQVFIDAYLNPIDVIIQNLYNGYNGISNTIRDPVAIYLGDKNIPPVMGNHREIPNTITGFLKWLPTTDRVL
jgi:hypothetical protein